MTDRVKELSAYDKVKRRVSQKKAGGLYRGDTLQECQDIVKRAIEFLNKRREVQDISGQVQFAAVIVAKFDKLKKNSFIQSDEVKKKICTLLRNVIRLNVTDDVFSEAQMELLKKGFLLLVTDEVKKADLLQLNRELRKENLSAMPAWE